MSAEADRTRTEVDFLGELEIPESALWGIHTARALQNFPISDVPLHAHPELIQALGQIKLAAARANRDLSLIDPAVADAIASAASEVATHRLDRFFVVDVIQGGAGTSTNMNANEVIANRALELLGHRPGAYDVVHPIDHVNRCQSTNDVYPTAVRLALVEALDVLAGRVLACVEALHEKAAEFGEILKIGRTQLQDAVPMTVGREFRGWAVTLSEELPRLRETRALLAEVNLGGTAIGTGITAPPAYSALVCRHLAGLTGMPIVPAADLVEATSDTGVFVLVSGAIKRVAVKLSKICNDLRLLGSGPQAGFGELRLPARQAGSSIMPGKVNPVIPEVVNQVAYAICGNDVSITMAAESGQLQLNAFEPLVAHRLLEGSRWLSRALGTLTENCIEGIEVDRARLAAEVERSVGVVTALAPMIGYATASEIAKAALRGEGTVRDLVLATGLLGEAELAALLSPSVLCGDDPELPEGDDPVALARGLMAGASLRW
ncbi:aspartate ammonia-lyase [Nocardioides sp. L-11A]|uniref:aspartate ammonia-lyase n=1 Tax=Nocardioides sp. L-11A TaxID=3043848 RepID=UPI00249B28C4|nr:aspartate ammonia-lyase [Nocardioides sp. L-11A]